MDNDGLRVFAKHKYTHIGDGKKKDTKKDVRGKTDKGKKLSK